MANVLFLAPADLGETVLATGALAHELHDGDKLTVVCAPDAAPLFRAAPGLIALHQTEGLTLWLSLMRTRFDVLIDARNGLLGRTLAAARRLTLKPPERLRHRVEDWAELVGAERGLEPKLWLDETARQRAAEIAPDAAPLIILAPGGVSSAKRWPHERFAAVARRLATGAIANARVLSMGAAPRDAEITRLITSSLDADGVPATDLGAGVDLLAAAALMERATLCLGNDNALTHIAAAVGAPTLTLFGPTDERVRAPYGPRTRTLRGRSLEQIAAQPELDGRGAMEDVSIDAVEAAALDLLHAGGLR
ncbi:glycosyltransferase family 9 protein [Vitreimonas sp.]|uniref:glycosyltransferase family 9 protein n=1 Tax=Vitreimonas sp. TaxID=3069702 RepID=UPI002ED78689